MDRLKIREKFDKLHEKNICHHWELNPNPFQNTERERSMVRIPTLQWRESCVFKLSPEHRS